MELDLEQDAFGTSEGDVEAGVVAWSPPTLRMPDRLHTSALEFLHYLALSDCVLALLDNHAVTNGVVDASCGDVRLGH